jgi:hypothetical protein
VSKKHDERVKDVRGRIMENFDAGIDGPQNLMGQLLAGQERQKRKEAAKKKLSKK